MSQRPMLIFASDVHLTDALQGSVVPKAQTFERFWVRVQAARGVRPAHLCFVGDLFDLVRSPAWLRSAYRPYHEPSAALAAKTDEIVAAILDRETEFFSRVRSYVQKGELEMHYLLGNHDRLLLHAPKARRMIWHAMTGEDRDIEFGSSMVFPDHGVLAYHGHKGDVINASPGGGPTIGDAIGSELIVRFPRSVREVASDAHPELDDIDDVRPVYAVPAWVRHLGTLRPELMRPINSTWSDLVEDFLSKPFVRDWMRGQHKALALDTGKKLRLMLELSTHKIMAKGHDQRLTQLYRVFQHAFDGRMARLASEQLSLPEHRGLRYVVNGHSHFSSMTPLGSVDGQPAAYFNTGTWRTVHQLGHDIGGRPAFLPYDAMCYLVFFPTGDPMGRDYEWWTGAMVSMRRSH